MDWLAKCCDAFAPKIQSIVEARGSVVFGNASGLTEQAVKDLTNRLPQSPLDLTELFAYVVFIGFV